MFFRSSRRMTTSFSATVIPEAVTGWRMFSASPSVMTPGRTDVTPGRTKVGTDRMGFLSMLARTSS